MTLQTLAKAASALGAKLEFQLLELKVTKTPARNKPGTPRSERLKAA